MESESTISPILATLALSSVFAVLFTMIAAEAPGAHQLRTFIGDHTQKLMLVVAGTAMAGSLYYSEIVGFEPCHFCWYQRIAMYPLAVLLLVAAVTRDRINSKYLVVIALAGLSLSIYHYQLQLFPNAAPTCSGPVSCSGKYVEQFGFITIPFMAGCGFLSILLLQVLEWRVNFVFSRWYDHPSEPMATPTYS